MNSQVKIAYGPSGEKSAWLIPRIAVSRCSLMHHRVWIVELEPPHRLRVDDRLRRQLRFDSRYGRGGPHGGANTAPALRKVTLVWSLRHVKWEGVK